MAIGVRQFETDDPAGVGELLRQAASFVDDTLDGGVACMTVTLSFHGSATTHDICPNWT
jgi:hypothetical protein